MLARKKMFKTIIKMIQPRTSGQFIFQKDTEKERPITKYGIKHNAIKKINKAMLDIVKICLNFNVFSLIII